uniref:Uncharacterized protein n=1 Tax=Glossina brevipalpis TaxID=37001 RepID=A0A1A9W2V1_9MUSC
MGRFKEPWILVFVTTCLSLSLADELLAKRAPSNENAFQKFFNSRFEWLPWVNSGKPENVQPTTYTYPVLPNNQYPYLQPYNQYAYNNFGILPQDSSPRPTLYSSGMNVLPIFVVFGPRQEIPNINPALSLVGGFLPNLNPLSFIQGGLPYQQFNTGQLGVVGQPASSTQIASQPADIVHTALPSHFNSNASSLQKGEDREQNRTELEASTQIPTKINEDIEAASYEHDKIPFNYFYPFLENTANQRNPIQRKLNDRMGLLYLRDLREGRKISSVPIRDDRRKNT